MPWLGLGLGLGLGLANPSPNPNPNQGNAAVLVHGVTHSAADLCARLLAQA